MCFHSKQTKDAQALEKRFNAKIVHSEKFRTGDFNGFMHPDTVIIANNRQEIIQFAQWGLIPEWAKDTSIQNSTLNAKIETIHEKPSFKNSISQRCLIPADGFYEWQWLDTSGKKKQKFLVHLPDDDLFSFAGLWCDWKNTQSGEIIRTYTILTTEANQLMSVVHNSKKRMPVIIHPKAEMKWLNGGNIDLYNDYLVANPLKAADEQLSLFD